MILNEIFERFIEKSPIPVAVRATLERVLSPEKLDHWFDLNAGKQYTRSLLFSTVFDLMNGVVFKVFPSVNAAYQSKSQSISVSIAATYDKLNGFNPQTAAALVRDTSEEMSDIIRSLKAQCVPLLPGYHVKMLDGNCIEKTEHRLKVLRHTNAGPLPGKALVVYDPRIDQAIDVFPCEDGHAQERSLFGEVLKTIQPLDVWVADRNFCVRDFLMGIDQAKAYYVIRHHQQMPYEIVGESEWIGDVDTGKVYEQQVKITDSTKKKSAVVRLIKIELTQKTRDKDDSLFILCNLPTEIDAVQIANIYRKRWSIETMFQKLTTHLKSEINTLAYPRAALFGFCISLITYNLLSVVKGAMRSVYGEEKIEKEVSGYYIAGEIARTTVGMEVILPPEDWKVFQTMSTIEFVRFLKRLMKNIILEKYKKHTRGKKKPLPKRDKNPKQPHVSTFKLLNEKTD